MKLLHCSSANASNSKDYCIYVHYDNTDTVLSYVIDAVRTISESGFNIVFVSSCTKLPSRAIEDLSQYAYAIAIRENLGYDFGSWSAGINYLKSTKVSVDKLLLTNDSVFGPFSNINSFKEASDNYDIYGLTDSHEHLYHVQSYFIIYSGRVYNHACFSAFWQKSYHQLNVHNWKERLILEKEVGGTQYFLENGFTIGVEYPYADLYSEVSEQQIEVMRRASSNLAISSLPHVIGTNPTHSHWHALVLKGFPYIKRELLKDNPLEVDLDCWAISIYNVRKDYIPILINTLHHYLGCYDFLYLQGLGSLDGSCFRDDMVIEVPIRAGLEDWISSEGADKGLARVRNYWFDQHFYISMNQDLTSRCIDGSLVSGYRHFVDNGRHEYGRKFRLVLHC